MSSPTQSKYIADLAVIKTKEFKEVKELLIASDIIGDDAHIVHQAQSVAEITHALTATQASAFIDVLIATKEPARGTTYSKRRIEANIDGLDDIKATIAGWKF